jgi:hypothetical protein
MKTNTNIISMNIAEITENRNALDKLEGVKLRHPDKALNGEKFVDKVITTELNLVMTRIRGVVNGMAPKNVGYDDEGTLTFTPRGRHKKSCLRWKTPMPIGYRTLELRWVDRLIEELVCNHQLKVVGYKTPATDAHSEDEWAYMNSMSLCDKIFDYSRTISDDKVRKNLRLEVAIRAMAYENSDSLINAFNELIQLVDDKGYFDPIVMATLMRAALVATTGSIEYPKEFTDEKCLDECFKTRFSTEMLLALGKAIAKNGESLPYKAFKDANPRITSKMYGGTKYPYIADALYGLGYLAFIMDDKHISKLIKYVSE